MNLQHVAFKIFVEGALTTDWEQFINVFHGWVATQSMPEMMIDVADYRHVPNGPGVVMVGHEADYYMDNTDGKPGLRYVCKIEKVGGNSDRIQHVLGAASNACTRLESEISGLKFSRTDFELTINDRGVAPNNAATRAALEAELPTVLERVFSIKGIKVEYQQDARRLAGATITLEHPIELASA